MRLSGILVLTVCVVGLAGCGSDETAAKKPAATATTKAAEAQPTSGSTFVRSASDPTSHVLHVTIKDEPPSDAYKAAAGETCTTTGAVSGKFQHQLIVSGPDKESDDSVLGHHAIPPESRLIAGNTCESTITITIPYSPKYTVGIAIEGRGIPLPTDPEATEVVTKGAEQDITVLR